MILLVASWQDPAQDAAHVAFSNDRMRELEPAASGIPFCQEALGRRPGRFVSDANLARRDSLRGEHDPDGVFHSWQVGPAQYVEV
jgi:hypothetical protein